MVNLQKLGNNNIIFRNIILELISLKKNFKLKVDLRIFSLEKIESLYLSASNDSIIQDSEEQEEFEEKNSEVNAKFFEYILDKIHDFSMKFFNYQRFFCFLFTFLFAPFVFVIKNI